MQELELKPGIALKIKFQGNTYELNKPKMGLVEELEDKIEAAKASKGQKGTFKLIKEFMVSCGLPEKVIRELDSDQVTEIIGALMPQKKT